MPSKTSKKKPAAALPPIPKEIIDQFVTGPMSAEAVHAASMAFKKALIERALGAELSHHLGYPPGAEYPRRVDLRAMASNSSLRRRTLMDRSARTRDLGSEVRVADAARVDQVHRSTE